MQSPVYLEFWKALRAGNARSGEFRRVGKNGKEVFLRAVYTPIVLDGAVVKIVKFAHDVTEEKLRNADFEGQIAAIGRTQAVVTFSPDSVILEANDLFLEAMGYTREEVVRAGCLGVLCVSLLANKRVRLDRSTGCLWTTCSRQCT